MGKKLAYVKKYKSVLNLIICTILSLLMGFLTVIAFQLEVSSDVIDFWFYTDLIFSFITFITLFSISISVFIKQMKFNRSTPKYYISLTNANSFNINGKVIDIKDIENVSFNKVHKWELFGEVKESNVGRTPILPVFKYEEKVAEKALQKAESNYSKSIKKSNLGNIIIELKSSKLILERVDDVENSVKEIKNIIKEKGTL